MQRRMTRNKIYCSVQILPARKSVRSHCLIDFPVALAVDADLRTGVVGFQDRYSGVAASDQVDGRCFMFEHEVESTSPIIPIRKHFFHVFRRRYYLCSQRTIPPQFRIVIEQAGIIGRYAEWQPAACCPMNRFTLSRAQRNHLL